MSSLFGSKPKPNKALQKSQRQQDRNIQEQTGEAAREAGGRRRILDRARRGGQTMFGPTGGAGVKPTFG